MYCPPPRAAARTGMAFLTIACSGTVDPTPATFRTSPDTGPTVTPQVTRLGQWGSYVWMRAAEASGGAAVRCLFHGNAIVQFERCEAGP